LDMQKKTGDAYIQAEQYALPLAKTDSTKAQVYYWEAIFLDELNQKSAAKDSWYRLIALPADVMPEDWRTQAFQYLNITPTFTITPSPTKTFTRTPTPSATTPASTATP
jgi:hypothetical protein